MVFTEVSFLCTEHSAKPTAVSFLFTEPSLSSTKPSLLFTETSLKSTESSLVFSERSLKSSEPSLMSSAGTTSGSFRTFLPAEVAAPGAALPRQGHPTTVPVSAYNPSMHTPPRRSNRCLVATLPLPLLLAACTSSNIRPVGENAPSSPVAIISGTESAVPNIPMGDSATIRRILDEGRNRNQVMDHLRYLSEEIGPRLTGSSNAETANRWTLEKFRSWGLDAELFQWGEVPVRFDRGPSTGVVQIAEKKKNDDGTTTDGFKNVRTMTLTTLAWTRGTTGPVRGRVLHAPETEDEFNKIKDQLPGAWILIKPTPLGGRQGVRSGGLRAGDRFANRREAREKVAAGTDPMTLSLDDRLLFVEGNGMKGVAGFIVAPMDDKDRIWTTAAPKWRERTIDQIPADVEITVRLSDYDYMNSRIADGTEVFAEFNLEHTLTQGPIPVYNTIAEIKGTTWPDEVVIVCGHMDSWNGPGSQGTTDNGTGSMVTLEAARILSTVNARPKRTIRFCLWTGEEQGLLGSRGYVKAIEDQWPKISAVLNDDGGTNYEGGLKCTPEMVDMLAAATAPVNYQFLDSKDGKPLNVNIQPQEKFPRAAASDHFSFVEKGIPGFFWDEVGRADYGFGWHTQHDRFDLAIPEYLAQSSTCAAITAYNLACAPTMLPRFVNEPSKDDAGPPLPGDKRGQDDKKN